MWKCVGQAWYHPQRCLFPSSTALMDNSELLSPKFTFSFTAIFGETWIAHIHSLKPLSKKADTQRSSVGMEKYDWLRKLYKKHRNHSANLFLPILYLVAITCLVWWNSRESVGKRSRSPPKGSYISLLYAPNVGSYHFFKKSNQWHPESLPVYKNPWNENDQDKHTFNKEKKWQRIWHVKASRSLPYYRTPKPKLALFPGLYTRTLSTLYLSC